MKVPLGDVRSEYDGFLQLAQLAAQLKEVSLQHIEIDMSRVQWFAANMCAPLGAILYKVSRNLNRVVISEIPAKVENILSRNGFLQNYGRRVKADTYGTTIEYKRFEPKDDRYFGSYINRYMVGRGLPEMSPGLRKKFQESIYEIFSNAVIHSRTKLGIYSCGQFFPTKRRLDFSIADLGMGIRQNVKEKIGLDLAGEKAIEWAITGHNTTKSGPVPGGLGLKLLREFIIMNQGRIQIVSDRGYLELKEGQPILKRLPQAFPGTVVNIEFNTADDRSYCLSSEIRPEDIF